MKKGEKLGDGLDPKYTNGMFDDKQDDRWS